jgi:hypothetical protein
MERTWGRRQVLTLARPAVQATAPEALPSDTVPLSPEMLKQVRDAVRRQARDLGATPEHAVLMADAIVGRLTVGEVKEPDLE